MNAAKVCQQVNACENSESTFCVKHQTGLQKMMSTKATVKYLTDTRACQRGTMLEGK
jgi:hypothetical protein